MVIAFLPRPLREPAAAMLVAIEGQWHIRLRLSKSTCQGRREHRRDSSRVGAVLSSRARSGESWKRATGGAAIVERDLAGGTLVLVGDSFPLSNQGLSNRATRL